MGKLNPKKLKVAELKSELEERNIQVTKGLKKADLVALLTSALEGEQGGDEEDELLFSEEDPDASGVAEGDTNEDEDLLALNETSKEEEKEIEEDKTEKLKEPVEGSSVQEELPNVSETEKEDVEEKMETDVALTTEAEVITVDQEDSTPAANAESVKKESDEGSSLVGDGANHEIHEQDVTKETTVDDNINATKILDNKSNQSPSGVDEDAVKSEKHPAEKSKEKSSESERSSRKRHHHDDHDRHRRDEERYAPPPEEPEEEFDDTLVVFDKYNSDLNMKLHRDRLTGQPLTLEGFAYLWAGARATYGVKNGKICYECKLVEEHSVRHLPSHQQHRHLVRVGWSPNLSSMMLGEEETSYAYCGTGKAITNQTAEAYGEAFKGGDVIGCYLDMTGDENATMSFTKNGVSLGVGFTVEKEKLNEIPLFPHVLCKNTTVEMNFGQKDEPYFAHPEGLDDYIFLAAVTLEERIRGMIGPTSRKDCEVMMMCGLPGAGKTFYANKHMEENLEKKYVILGTNSLLNQMQVSGLEEKPSSDVLMQHATNCLNRLLQVACRKKRNFILDQTNVYSSAQRRKMRPFEGFRRKAIVVVPSDEEFKTRVEKRTKDEGKDIPDIAVYEMKANFTIPEVGNLFDDVIFIDLGKEEASKLIEEYREEAKKHAPPPEKRFKGGFDSNRSGGHSGWGHNNRRSYGEGTYNRYGGNQQGGFKDRNRGGDGGRNYGNRGGWNDNKGQWAQSRNYGGRGGYQGGNRGGYGGNRNNGEGYYNNRNSNRFSQQNRSYGNQQGGHGGQSRSREGGSQSYSGYSQQTSAQRNNSRGYKQQSYNNQRQSTYSQQWAQYYQQATPQQQQHSQNYYTDYQ